jgi:hypothetical protein
MVRCVWVERLMMYWNERKIRQDLKDPKEIYIP